MLFGGAKKGLPLLGSGGRIVLLIARLGEIEMRVGLAGIDGGGALPRTDRVLRLAEARGQQAVVHERVGIVGKIFRIL